MNANVVVNRFTVSPLSLLNWLKLSCLVVLSIFAFGLKPAFAHEIEPAIVDISREGDQLLIQAEVSAEAILAGINLSETTDTQASDQDTVYDEFRLFAPEELETAFQNAWPDLQNLFFLSMNNGQQSVGLNNINVSEIGNVELSRTSVISLSANIPAGATEFQFGWDPRLGVMVLRRSAEEGGFAGYVDPGEMSPVISLTEGGPQSGWEAFVEFIPVGFDHILPKGLDHILFVVGLFLLSASLRPLLWQVTAFTAAHTITLALASLGIITVSPSIVEPLIAISIAYVAIENIFTPKMTRWRPALIFAFGLLHGLGFASVLADFGLPGTGFVGALLGFNLGVEIGQLVVILLCFASFGYWFKDKPWYRTQLTIPMSVVIAGVGLYWAYERVFL